MSTPENLSYGDDTPEADLAEQRIPVDSEDEERAGLDPSRVTVDRESDANEADLIEQAMEVPVDDDDFDR